MNKIDLIIDRLELAKKFSWNHLVVTSSLDESLAAARELREMEPVAITSSKHSFECQLFDGVELPDETLLYALMDEKHESLLNN
jgi:hypothetical protein